MAISVSRPSMHHWTRLAKRREVANGTWSFYFEKPEGFVFKAGQFVELTILYPKESDAEGNTRSLSISSAPYEHFLSVTTRMRDTAFKRNLSNMISGTEVSVSDPAGEMILHEDDARPAVILAGGIGITPFRSIVFEAAHRRLPHRLSVFYSNRRPEDAAFLEELHQLQQVNPNYQLFATMTQLENSNRPWVGEMGPIDSAMLGRHVTSLEAPIFYIAGPPRMVRGVRTMLNAAGVRESAIRIEEFDGY
jgi:ferredoxin-NADP reductase